MRLHLAALLMLFPLAAAAQTGVSDDRVSLPEGPGSLEGVGENIENAGNMGDLSWSIPLPVTEGFPGLTPDLTLSYSSGAGAGPAGIGWSMNLPAIERNTVRGLPRYDIDDDFHSSGAQLVRVADDPPTYRERFEGAFVRYVWLDRGNGAGGYWRADYPDGRVGYFGADARGRTVANAREADPVRGGVFKYSLVELVDVFGHAQRWDYIQDHGWTLPVRVGWVHPNGAPEPVYEATFRYEPSSDASGAAELSDAKAGFDRRLTQRLAEVTFRARGQRVRSWRLSYERYADAGGATRLVRFETLGAGGEVHPARFDLTYSRALGGLCGGGDCRGPYVVPMGSIGVGLESGQVSFVDINGDGLADVLNTPLDEPHRFFLNVPDEEGGSAFDPAVESAFEGPDFLLGSGYTELLDVDGNGFADLINSRTGAVLFNDGLGDWARRGTLGDVATLPDFEADFEVGQFELGTIRFLDYDNDKRIDVLRSTRQDTTIYRNGGGGEFAVDEAVTAIGAGVAEDDLQLADMNGDGLLDPVRMQADSVSYRLNLGRGRWADWRQVGGVTLSAADVPLSSLEDLNGDGLADLVTVSGTTVRYALNRNGAAFFAVATLRNADVEGDIPERGEGVAVLYADMNANGSTDVVWVDRQGNVDYLELFPVRPNLISRVENGLGKVMDVTFGTSAQHLARDGGAWAHPLPHPMIVVDRTDTWDRLSEEHEITEFEYRDGFYDGAEKQFRGYASVLRRDVGDESHDNGSRDERYDVGDADAYRHGRLLETVVRSGQAEIRVDDTTYEDCALAGLPARFEDYPVRWICPVATRSVLKEGLPQNAWVTTETTTSHDGYGNAVRQSDLGVTSRGGGCAACGNRGADVFGEPCGAQCLGDERHVEMEYVPPANTGGRWLLRAPAVTRIYGRAGGEVDETITYYDGPAFQGLAQGRLTEGRVTRQTRAVAAGRVIEVVRNEFDGNGNVITTLDPLGQPNGTTHLRRYTYDTDGLRVVRTDLLLEDPAGAPYTLRRETTYEPLFDRVSESTGWMRIAGGENRSARRSRFFTYDTFGRLNKRVLPGGDDLANPTEVFVYELGSPVSRVVTRRRSTVGGQLDIETSRCVDGRGREIQTRTRLDDNRYLVSGFTLFDHRSAPRRIHQPYEANAAACDLSPPAGVAFSEYTYDGIDRPVAVTAPDAALHGTPSVSRLAYEPLATLSFDEEDADPASPHANTPRVTRADGLGRPVRVERVLAPGQTASTQIRYDGLGRLSGYVDAAGNVKSQRHDLSGRLVEIDDPNAGRVTLEYDDAGNLLARTDARGETVARAYDGANRLAAVWDPADEEGTRITLVYDKAPGCRACTHPEGVPAQITYPGGALHNGFDARGRTTYSAREIEGVEYVTTYGYDNVDRLVSTTHPNGREVQQTHDRAARLTGVPGVLTEVSYEPRGMPVGLEHADGTRDEWTFDTNRRLSALRTLGPRGEVWQGMAYDRDRTGRVLETSDDSLLEPTAAALHVYDQGSRLTRFTAGDVTLDFTFDLVDNVTARSDVGAMTYGEDGAGPNAVTGLDGRAIGYDDAGQRTSARGRDLVWDYMGRLVAAGDDARFGFGEGPERLWREEEGGSVTHTVGRDFEVRDGVASVYVRAVGGRVARIRDPDFGPRVLSDRDDDGEITSADALLASDDEGGRPDRLLWGSVRRMLAQEAPETVHLHGDRLGNLTLATDGEVLGKRQFLPTGEVRQASGFVDPHGFTGQEQDASTGFIHFPFRSLDPVTGRWASPDPLFARLDRGAFTASADGQGTTAYAFVANDPANLTDASGLKGLKERLKGLFTKKKAVPAALGGAAAQSNLYGFAAPVQQTEAPEDVAFRLLRTPATYGDRVEAYKATIWAEGVAFAAAAQALQPDLVNQDRDQGADVYLNMSKYTYAAAMASPEVVKYQKARDILGAELKTLGRYLNGAGVPWTPDQGGPTYDQAKAPRWAHTPPPPPPPGFVPLKASDFKDSGE